MASPRERGSVTLRAIDSCMTRQPGEGDDLPGPDADAPTSRKTPSRLSPSTSGTVAPMVAFRSG
ncbi:hypothetical protein GCM10010166_43200 [Couchioplanes caeruleus subsp. azureus]|nr:hypothetical protein GCM10010166_43200 [Couchioplanes caeruleus subsp. azureus]